MMKKLRKNIGKQYFYSSLKKNQISRNELKLCKLSLQGKLQTTEESNQRRLQKVERSPMLMD
jgi:hypothetical protein